jgi:hypothetical protein
VDREQLRIQLPLCVSQDLNVRSAQLSKCHVNQVITILALELLSQHAQFVQPAHSVNFTILYQVGKLLSKTPVLLASTVRTLVLMQALLVYQDTFRRPLVSRAALFALLDFTVLSVVCPLRLRVQNSLFARQVV